MANANNISCVDHDDDYISLLGFNNTICPSFSFPKSRNSFQICGYIMAKENSKTVVESNVVLQNENGLKLEQDSGLFVQIETDQLQSLVTCRPIFLSLQSTCPCDYYFYGSHVAGMLGSILLYNGSATTIDVALPISSNYRYTSIYVVAPKLVDHQPPVNPGFHIQSGLCNVYVQDMYVGTKPVLVLPTSPTSPPLSSIYGTSNSNANSAASGSNSAMIVYISLAVMVPVIILSICGLISWRRHRNTSIARKTDLEAWISNTADNNQSTFISGDFSATSPMRSLPPVDPSEAAPRSQSSSSSSNGNESVTIDRRTFRSKRVVNPSPLRVEVAAPPTSPRWRFWASKSEKVNSPSMSDTTSTTVAKGMGGSLKGQIDYIRNKYGFKTNSTEPEPSSKVAQNESDVEAEIVPLEGRKEHFDSSKSFVL